MPQLSQITTSPTLTFDALAAGDASAPLVLLLHGFAESMHCWRAQVTALAAAGYRAIAPGQRGYSPGARPDTGDVANYHIERLMDDAMAIVAASGYGEARFHLAATTGAAALPGRWPTVLRSGWRRSRCCPGRTRTPSIVRCRSPMAIRRSGRGITRRFSNLMPPMSCWADDARWLRERLAANGVPADAIAKHLSVLGDKDAMEAALAWYRARGAIRGPLGPIRVPTLYIWGDADDTVGRTAAEGTVDFVAASYRFEVLPGVGHFAADQVPERVSALLLAHVASHPA